MAGMIAQTIYRTTETDEPDEIEREPIATALVTVDGFLELKTSTLQVNARIVGAIYDIYMARADDRTTTRK